MPRISPARSAAIVLGGAAGAACVAAFVEGTVAGVAVLLAAASGLFLVRARAQAAAARRETSAALTRLQAIVDSMADGVIFVDSIPGNGEDDDSAAPSGDKQ